MNKGKQTLVTQVANLTATQRFKFLNCYGNERFTLAQKLFSSRIFPTAVISTVNYLTENNIHFRPIAFVKQLITAYYGEKQIYAVS